MQLHLVKELFHAVMISTSMSNNRAFSSKKVLMLLYAFTTTIPTGIHIKSSAIWKIIVRAMHYKEVQLHEVMHMYRHCRHLAFSGEVRM